MGRTNFHIGRTGHQLPFAPIRRNASPFAAAAGVAASLALGSPAAHAGNVTLTTADASGTSSFNSAGHWSNGLAPSAGNAYFNNGQQLRSPADGGSYTFAGDSLSLDPTTLGSTATRFLLKGLNGTLTINNLIMNGGDMEQAANTAGNSTSILGNITLNAGTTSGLDASVFTPGLQALYLYAPISGSGNVIIDRFQTSDSSTVFYESANTYTGTTTVANNGGSSELDLVNSLALQNSTLVNGGTSVTIILTNTNVNSGGAVTFDSAVSSHAFTFGGMSGSSGLTLADNAATPNAVALSLGNNNSSNTYSGVLSGAGSLNKIGTGTQTLSAANTYAGGTTITSGTLSLINATGSGTGSGAVALSGGNSAVLSGTGISTGALTVTNGSILAPGVNTSGVSGGVGQLTLGNTTLTNATLAFDLSSTSVLTSANDFLSVGSLSLGTVAFSFYETGGSLVTGQNYTLMTATSLPTGFTGSYTTLFNGGQSYTATYSIVGNSLDVRFTGAAATPEPSALALIATGMLGGVGVWGRRRRG